MKICAWFRFVNYTIHFDYAYASVGKIYRFSLMMSVTPYLLWNYFFSVYFEFKKIKNMKVGAIKISSFPERSPLPMSLLFLFLPRG